MMTKEGIRFNGITANTCDHFMTFTRRFDSHAGNRQSPRAMRFACWSIVVVLALGACGSRAPADGVLAGAGDPEWVCRPDDEAWDCAQGVEPPRPPDEPD